MGGSSQDVAGRSGERSGPEGEGEDKEPLLAGGARSVDGAWEVGNPNGALLCTLPTLGFAGVRLASVYDECSTQ